MSSQPLTREYDNLTLSRKTLDSLSRVDAMPAALRECVHDYGLPIVEVLTKFGVKNPAHIREVVRCIWMGARGGAQREAGNPLGTADWLLSQSAGHVNISSLLRALADNQMTIVPLTPTRAMLAASMNEVSGYNLKVTKEEKHRLRLRAAATAAQKELLSGKFTKKDRRDK